MGDVIGARGPHRPKRGVNVGCDPSQGFSHFFIIAPKGRTAAGVCCSCFSTTLAQTAFVRHMLRPDALLQVVRGGLVGPK
jgi:hypothetical protein